MKAEFLIAALLILFAPISILVDDYSDPIGPARAIPDRNDFRWPSWQEIRSSLEYAFRPILDLLKRLDPIGSASAACTGDSCFWIGGTGDFNDGNHWSLSSGGAACGCTPDSDDALIFDSNSGSGTATQNVAGFASGAVTSTTTSITIAAFSNAWTVSGNWDTSAGTFAPGTSSIQFVGTLSIKTASIAASFYDVSSMAPSGATTTIIGTVGILHTLALGTGTLTGTGTKTIYFACGTCNTAAILTNLGATISVDITIDHTGSTQAITIPALTMTGTLTFFSDLSYTATLSGALSATTLTMTGFGAGTQTFYTSASNHAVTLSNLNLNAFSTFNMSASTVTISTRLAMQSGTATLAGTSFNLILSRDDGGDAFLWTNGTFQAQTQPSAVVNFTGTSNLNIPTVTGAGVSVYMPKLSMAKAGETTSINNGGGAEYIVFCNLLQVNGGVVTTTSLNLQFINMATFSAAWPTTAYIIATPTAVSGQVSFIFGPQYGNSVWGIPGGDSYGAIAFGGFQDAGATQTFNFLGDVTLSGLSAISNSITNSAYVINQNGYSFTATSIGGPDLGNFSVTWNTGGGNITTTSLAAGWLNPSNIAGPLDLFVGTVAMNFSSSTVSLAGPMIIRNFRDYFVLGSSIWTVYGWENGSNSTSWNAGESRIIFRYPRTGNNSTAQFMRPQFASYEFFDLDIHADSPSDVTVRAVNTSLRVRHQLTIGPDYDSRTTFNDEGFGVTAGCIVILRGGAIIITGEERIEGCTAAIHAALFDFPWIIVYVAIMTMAMVGAWSLKKRREG